MSPQVSIVIPCYNTARYVGQALQSVFAQSFTDFEVVLINDGSPDTEQLEAAIAPWRERITYLKTENRGLAAARNHGIQASRGNLIALLDSDDYWHPEYLAVQERTLRENPQAGVVYPNAVVFFEPPSAQPTRLLTEMAPSRGEVTFSSLVNETCTVMVSALMRRTVLEKAGFFDESLRRCEDFDLWLRCAKSGVRIIYHKQPLVHYRRRDDSLSANHTSMLETRVHVLRRAKVTLPLTGEEHMAAEAGIARSIATAKYLEARHEFLRRNFSKCVRSLLESHRLHPRRRVVAMLLALATVPTLAHSAYTLRLRFLHSRLRGRSRPLEAGA